MTQKRMLGERWGVLCGIENNVWISKYTGNFADDAADEAYALTELALAARGAGAGSTLGGDVTLKVKRGEV